MVLVIYNGEYDCLTEIKWRVLWCDIKWRV